MDKIKKYILKKKYILLFISVLFIFGFLIGLYLSISNISFLKEDVAYYVSNINSHTYNYMFIHFFLLVVGLVLSFFAIGIPYLCTILFYEGLTSGFLIGLFSSIHHFGGFIFALLFILITKFAYLLLFILFFLKSLEIARRMIGKYIYKTDSSLVLVNLLKANGFLIFFVFLCDLLVYYCAPKVLYFFRFLLT